MVGQQEGRGLADSTLQQTAKATVDAHTPGAPLCFPSSRCVVAMLNVGGKLIYLIIQ